jgi:uncharacterized protein (DUF433 family)
VKATGPSVFLNFCKLEKESLAVELKDIVSRDSEIVSGELCFTGTRVPAQSLIDHLKAGDTLEEFLEGFPSVSREQAEAFLATEEQLRR